MRRLVRIAALFLAALPVRAAEDLAAVLARMDTASAAFKSVVADFEQTVYTAILNDTSKESGTFRMLRRKPNDIRVLIDIAEPDPRTAAFSGRKAEIYYPKMATVQEFDLGKYKNLVEQFMLLGFGSSGRDLARGYTVTSGGSDPVAGQPASRLELVPKDVKARDQFVKIELWINSAGYPLRQRFHEPSGNHRTANYSGIKVNQDISADALTLKVPGNVKREYPQK